MFMCSSTCFGRPHAHHQELNNCSSRLWFYRWSVVVAVLFVVVGPVMHCYHHTPMVKSQAATAVVEILMTGVRTPETCWAVHKRQVNKLEKLLHLVGWFIGIAQDYFYNIDFCLLVVVWLHAPSVASVIGVDQYFSETSVHN